MSDFDNFRLRYWESAENLKEYLSEILERQISTKLATQISNHLAQGRLYFESASQSPYEIKPVLIFYGMVGFANALTLARNHRDESALPNRHGLKDVSPDNPRLMDLTLKVVGNGTFQLFNDTANIKKVRLSDNSIWKDHYCFSSKAETLGNKEITLKQVLSRIPTLELLYKDTFGQDPNLVSCTWPGVDPYKQCIDFEIIQYKPFRTPKQIFEITNDLKLKYPFLKKWTLTEARWSWETNSLTFANISFDEEKMEAIEYLTKEGFLGEVKNGFIGKDWVFDKEKLEFDQITPPMTNSNGGAYLIEEFDGADISEASLYYMGAFILSSLVRYRPNTWIHSIKGRHTERQPRDDKALAITLKFLDLALINFPNMILDLIKEPPHNKVNEQ